MKLGNLDCTSLRSRISERRRADGLNLYFMNYTHKHMDKFGAIYGWLENSWALQKYDQVGVQQQVSISRETQLFGFLINFTS